MIQPMVFLREDKSPWIYSSTTILIANSKHPSIDSKMQETTNRYHLALYEAAREPVRADKGSPYPCTQRDIDLVVNGLAENPNFQYNTPSFVTNRLVQWLSQDPSPSVTVALQRLRACTTPDRWGPDLAIKAFKDLDLAFFNGTLLGHCMVKWYGRSAWMELLAERGVSHRALVATTLRTRPAECIIQLNAEEHLLHKGLTPQPWKTVWETLLHEMVHAYHIINCDADSSLPHPADLPIFSYAGHGTYFRRCVHAVHNRAKRFLGISVIADVEDYKEHA